jgi:hypothetical protein
MKKLGVISIVLVSFLFGVRNISAQIDEKERADLALRLQQAENRIQREAFRATRTFVSKPDGFLFSTKIVECDGKGNVRWKITLFGRATMETILVNNRVFQREGSGEWKEITDRVGNGFGTIAVTKMPTFEDDTNIYYHVKLMSLFFLLSGQIGPPEDRTIDGKQADVFEVIAPNLTTHDPEPKYSAQFTFDRRGRFIKYMGIGRRSTSDKTVAWDETEIKFQYDI